MFAVYFHPEGYSTRGPKLMGRHAAGESFLRGFLQYSEAASFWAQVEQAAHGKAFMETVRAAGRKEPVRIVDTARLEQLREVGGVYFPGPGIGPAARQRSLFGDAAWSLCGITHTTSSAGAMDSLAELITAPVQPWDAVICTSTAVKDNVLRLLGAQQAYLRERLGITQVVLPELPVIPLGIHTRDFDFSEAQRAEARRALGVDAQARVVLFVGRLSFHAKAHPLAMYQALEAAARSTGVPVVLVECGWYANDFIEKAYDAAAAEAAPSVRRIVLDGREPASRQHAWAAADVFCSLSDNIQESFGITPIEAMAAGLPVVVSDWDGYRDTVRDQIDGFRIPTLMPAEGLGRDLAARHALEIDSYDLYCGHACSLVAVDLAAATRAFEALLQSDDLRLRMGAAGRERARQVFDWAHIIARYQALWSSLSARRLAEGSKAGESSVSRPASGWPARPDPFAAFAAYPTQQLAAQTLLCRVDATTEQALERLNRLQALAMVNFARAILPGPEDLRQVLEEAGTTARPAIELVQSLPAARQGLMFRSLVWLIKIGVLRLA